MKIINLLEDVAFSKATNRFLFVFQDFLLDQYPEFKTKIVNNNLTTKINSKQVITLSKCIHWQVGNTLFMISFTIFDNNFIEVCVSTKHHYNKAFSQLHVNFYTIEELAFENFDIVSSVNQLLSINSPYAYGLLKDIMIGKIDSLEQYLND